MRYLGLCVAVATLAAAGSAGAQTQDQTSDLRCVAIFSGMIGNPRYAELKDSTSAGLFYFLGRADGRQPGMDLGAQLRQVREDMPMTQYGDEARRCFATLKKRNNQLKALGQTDAQPAKP